MALHEDIQSVSEHQLYKTLAPLVSVALIGIVGWLLTSIMDLENKSLKNEQAITVIQNDSEDVWDDIEAIIRLPIISKMLFTDIDFSIKWCLPSYLSCGLLYPLPMCILIFVTSLCNFSMSSHTSSLSFCMTVIACSFLNALFSKSIMLVSNQPTIPIKATLTSGARVL